MSRLHCLCVILGLAAGEMAAAQAIVFEGNLHTPLGNAILMVDAQGRLVISNIGNTGLDGVSIELGRAASFDVTYGNFPTNPRLGVLHRVTAFGSVNDVPDINLGNLSLTRSGPGLAFSASFAGLSAPSKTVQVYLNGMLLENLGGVTAPQVATLGAPVWPTTIGVRQALGPQNRFAFVSQWTQVVTFTLPGGIVISGNELRVLAESPPSTTLDFVAEVDNTESEMPDVFFLDEITEPECPGDVNGDGRVDLEDVALLLGNFGLTGDLTEADGDLDGNNEVDLGDVATVLANFGNNCM